MYKIAKRFFDVMRAHRHHRHIAAVDCRDCGDSGLGLGPDFLYRPSHRQGQQAVQDV